MKIWHMLVQLLAAVVMGFYGSSISADEIDLARRDGERLLQAIGDRDVIFYAIDLQSQQRFAYQPNRAHERHAPYSTFKIPNLVIALETGAASELNHKRVWDTKKRPAMPYWPEAWKQDQTLESAFKRSAAWYFQDLAVDVGGENYRRLLQEFGYGNADAPDGNDFFWLGGPLMISPKEQTQFISRLVTGGLGVKPSSVEALRQVSQLREVAGHTLNGKTGSGPVQLDNFNGEFEGWLVGWVDRPQAAPVVYALYAKGQSFDAINRFRTDMTIHFLELIGALPKSK